MAATRAEDIAEAAATLEKVLTALRVAGEAGPDAETAALASSAMGAGLTLVVGLVLDLNRIASALERIADQEKR